MEVPSYNFKFCRACLEPEESENFSRIFDDNARMATKIHKLTGLVLMDVNKKIPSLICEKCILELDAADKLRTRILDADDYFVLMTAEAENDILDKGVKSLTKGKQNHRLSAQSSTPARSSSDFSFKTPTSISRSAVKKTSTKKKSVLKINPNRKHRNENIAPKKRKLEIDDLEEDFSDGEYYKTPKHSKFISTPAKLGIQRMLIKTKTFIKGQRMKFGSGGKLSKKITFECDTCLETFESYQLLNMHLSSHKDDMMEDLKRDDGSMTNILDDSAIEPMEIKMEECSEF